MSDTAASTPDPAADDRPEWSAETFRWVDLTRMGKERYKATNRRGGVLPIGSGDDPDFTPVELLLAALAGCAAIDIDLITGKRAEATTFEMRTTGHKIRDEQGSHLVDLKISLDIRFPEGPDGDHSRGMLPRAVQQTRDRLCTVGRTVALGEPVEYVEKDLAELEISRR
jgi:putative redox protein